MNEATIRNMTFKEKLRYGVVFDEDDMEEISILTEQSNFLIDELNIYDLEDLKEEVSKVQGFVQRVETFAYIMNEKYDEMMEDDDGEAYKDLMDAVRHFSSECADYESWENPKIVKDPW